jgi:hypothetical protein
VREVTVQLAFLSETVLHFMDFKFIRIHRMLRVIPAMKAGIADHVRSMEEPTALLDARGKANQPKLAKGLGHVTSTSVLLEKRNEETAPSQSSPQQQHMPFGAKYPSEREKARHRQLSTMRGL